MRIKVNIIMLIAIGLASTTVSNGFLEAERAFSDPAVVGAPQQSVLLTEAVFYALVALIILVASTFLRIEFEYDTKKKPVEPQTSLSTHPLETQVKYCISCGQILPNRIFLKMREGIEAS